MTKKTTPWKQARTTGDLGRNMADWLEGKHSANSPSSLANGPDEETRNIVPTLAAINRAGFVTTDSQPGLDLKARGSRQRQKAAVQGYIADKNLLNRIRRAARDAGIEIITRRAGSRPRPGVPVTEIDGEDYTWFGHVDRHRRQVEYDWHGTGGRAKRELRAAWQVTLIDPEYGRDDRLWPMLRKIAERR